MNRLIRVVLILGTITVAGFPAAPRVIGSATARANDMPRAVVENHGHLTVLRLRGTPYEMGHQHGIAQQEVIRRWVSEWVYDRAILGSGQSHGVVLAQARQLARTLPPDIRRELRGIADGAGLSYEDVLLLNLVLNRWPAPSLLPAEAASPPPMPALQALVFAAWPPATGQSDALDDTFLGYRLNAPGQAASLRRHLLAIVYQPANGQTYATLTWSGQVGAWCGLNEANLAVCATPANGSDTSHQELPPAILTRRLLAQAQDGEQALRQALKHDYINNFHLVVADGTHRTATAIAFGAHGYDIVESETGVIIVGPGQAQLASLLDSNLGWVTRDKALAALSSRQAPDEETPGVCGESTLLNVLLVPNRGELWISLDLWPASCRRYLRLHVGD